MVTTTRLMITTKALAMTHLIRTWPWKNEKKSICPNSIIRIVIMHMKDLHMNMHQEMVFMFDRTKNRNFFPIELIILLCGRYLKMFLKIVKILSNLTYASIMEQIFLKWSIWMIFHSILNQIILNDLQPSTFMIFQISQHLWKAANI
jgi:hypothetical protein